MSTTEEELAALRTRVERLEELTRFQAITLINIWGLSEDSEVVHNKQYSKEIEDSIRKIVDLFGVD